MAARNRNRGGSINGNVAISAVASVESRKYRRNSGNANEKHGSQPGGGVIGVSIMWRNGVSGSIGAESGWRIAGGGYLANGGRGAKRRNRNVVIMKEEISMANRKRNQRRWRKLAKMACGAIKHHRNRRKAKRQWRGQRSVISVSAA